MRFFFSLSIAKTHYACTHPEGLFSAPLLAVSLVIARLVPLYIHFLSNVLICCHDKEVPAFSLSLRLMVRLSGHWWLIWRHQNQNKQKKKEKKQLGRSLGGIN